MGVIAGERRLAALSYAVVDVETTGTAPGRGDRITEVAVVVVRDGRVHETFSTLVNPERPIPRYITQLTGISWAMVKDAPSFREVSDDLRTRLAGHVFVAHNAPFDWGFVTMEMARTGVEGLDNERLCTVRLARKLLSQLPRRSLDHVTAHYGIVVESRHRALGDARATAQVLTHLLDDAFARGCDTWDDLDHLLHPGVRRRRRWSALPHSVTDDRSA
ncbi:MAG: 3'-5' exonuclease [Gemmatimonadaceae bacterium]